MRAVQWKSVCGRWWKTENAWIYGRESEKWELYLIRKENVNYSKFFLGEEMIINIWKNWSKCSSMNVIPDSYGVWWPAVRRMSGDEENSSKRVEEKQVTEDLTMAQPRLTCVFWSVFDFFFFFLRSSGQHT